MGKKALVVQAKELENFFKLPYQFKAERTVRLRKGDSGVSTFYATHSMIADRTWCETDDSVVQYIPYITLYRRTEKSVEFFVYQRGKAGTEDRLHDLFSLGIGGHVEEMPDLPNETLKEVLYRAACREIEEELGKDVLTTDVTTSITDGLDTAIVYLDTRTVTESVHLAVMLSIDVTNSVQTFQLEENVIENTSWKSMEDVQDLIRSNAESLEPWSRVAARNFRLPSIAI